MLLALLAIKVLYVTHTAGFRHDTVPLSQQVLSEVGARAGIEVTSTEDLSLITADSLRNFDALFFFTSDHPAVRQIRHSFAATDEIYQFREFSRSRVRVLLTLDTRSVDLNAPGVNRTDGDFALAWCRNFGEGRVFYTALGHTEQTFFQTMLQQALLWLGRAVDGDAAPRSSTPVVNLGGIVDASTYLLATTPGSYISIFGSGLTTGSTTDSWGGPLPLKLAGTSVLLNGIPLPLLYVSPLQINARLPEDFPAGTANAIVSAGNQASPPEPVLIVQ
jgi:hypothetical protein